MKTKSSPTAPALSVAPDRLATLARSIKATAEDIRTMTLAAGVEAMEEALADCGRLELPLRFHIAPPGTRAIFIPEDIHRQLQNAGQLAGLDDPATDLVSWIMEGTVDDPENLMSLASDLADNQRQEGGLEA